jgi:hypothetical protein
MKIIIATTFTSYNKPVIIKPLSSLWQIINLGTAPVIINETYLVRQLYTAFGVDTTDLFIPTMLHYIKTGKAIKIENDTQFKIEFGEPLFFGYEYPAKKFLLTETFFKIIK